MYRYVVEWRLVVSVAVCQPGRITVGRQVGRQASITRACRSALVWVYGEGSANGKHEDEDDAERTRKIYYGLPHLGGEDATAVRGSQVVGEPVPTNLYNRYHYHPLSPFTSLSVLSCPFSLSPLLLPHSSLSVSRFPFSFSCQCHAPVLAYDIHQDPFAAFPLHVL